MKSLKEILTPAQFKLSRLVAFGKPNKEIALILRLSEYTIKRSLYHIFDRAGIPHHNRTSLAVRFVLEEEDRRREEQSQMNKIPDPVVGEVWISSSGNPFDEPRSVRVLDLKQGYIKYSLLGSTFSSRIDMFKLTFKKQEGEQKKRKRKS